MSRSEDQQTARTTHSSLGEEGWAVTGWARVQAGAAELRRDPVLAVQVCPLCDHSPGR